MNKRIPIYKRLGAMFLCLALLCGVIMSTVVLPMPVEADATNSVSTFSVDFTELKNLVTGSFTNGAYVSTADDTAINEWVDKRFGVFFTRETSKYQELDFLGQNTVAYDTGDTWSGDFQWNILNTGALRMQVSETAKTDDAEGTLNQGGQMMRKNMTLPIKDANGNYAKLKNFEAEMVFNKGGLDYLGSVFISFHETEPGRLNINCNSQTLAQGTDAVIVGNGPATYSYNGKGNDGIRLGNLKDGNCNSIPQAFTPLMDDSADYKLTVKVVGTSLTAKVTKVSDGTELFDNSTNPTTIADNAAGYLSFGVSNAVHEIKSVKVTELNSKGEPIDFGSREEFSWTTVGKTGYANGKHTYNTPDDTSDDKDWYTFVDANAGKEDTEKIINALNESFDIFYNSEGKYCQMQAGVKAAYDGQTSDYGWFNTVYENSWLQRPIDGNPQNYSQNLRLITSLSPKRDGKALVYKNFETTFKVRIDGSNDASIVFGFRQATPGKFVNGYYNVNKEQGLVVVNRTGIVVSGGENIYSGHTSDQPNTGDMYNTDATATFASSLANGANVTVYVKAVGEQVTVKVSVGSTVYYNDTVTVPYTEAGYLAYGIANRGSDMGTITLRHLDDEGEPLKLDKQTEAEYALFAETWALDFNDLPGAEYKSNTVGETTQSVYMATATATSVGRNWINFNEFPDTQAEDEIKKYAATYYNDQDTYTVAKLHGNSVATNGVPTKWLLFGNRWLQRNGASGSGTRVDQINTIVPKDGNGAMTQVKNLEVSFDFRFESNSTAVFGFRQKNPGQFVNGADGKMNTEQVMIAVTRNSIAGAGGTDITKELFYRTGEFEDTAFSDVFAAQLPQDVTIKIKAVGKDVSVKIYSGSTLKHTFTFTTDYTIEGYVSFGVSKGGGNLGAMSLARLNDSGLRVDFTNDLYADKDFGDSYQRFYADFAVLSRRVDSESYENGVYTSDADDTFVNNWASNKFALYYNRDTVYAERAHLGQDSTALDAADTTSSYWQLGQNGTLIHKASAAGTLLGKTDALVLKTMNGSLATAKNFKAEYVVDDAGKALGAVTLSFRSTTPGKLVTDANALYTEQQFVSIGNDANGAGIAFGGAMTQGADGEYAKFETAIAELDDALITQYKVTVEAINEDVSVKVTSVDDADTYYEGSFKSNIHEKGYISLSVSGDGLALGSLTVTEYDAKGAIVDFGTGTQKATVGKFYFSVTGLIPFSNNAYTASKTNADGSPILDAETGEPINGTAWYNFIEKYGENAHPDASTVINYLDGKFALYYNCEARYAQMEAGVRQAYAGQTADTGAFQGVYSDSWLQRGGSYGGTQNFRMINSLVPRHSETGEELQFENFETSVNVRFENSKVSKQTGTKVDVDDEDEDGDTEEEIPVYEQVFAENQGAFILGFRQKTPGKFVDSYWNINQEQAFVAVTPHGITIAGGEDIVSNMARDPETGAGLHKSAEGDMYNDDQTVKFDNAVTVAITSVQNVKVYVKVVGDQVTVKVTSTSGATTYYEGTHTVNYGGSGYLAYGFGSRSGNIGNIELARLDENGEVVDVNGSTSILDCPWDTTVDRYSEIMNTANSELERFYDFYYSAIEGGSNTTVPETVDVHWALDADNVLMRHSDLSENATDKVAMMTLDTNEQGVKLAHFDAVFKLKLDDSEKGTFWVTARQDDATKLGKIVSTPGETDYVDGQIGVGFAVGGAITIANGSADPIVIAGPTAGTPTGTYTLRVRLYGNKLEVYVNGAQRVVRTLSNAPTGEGYLSFGYSGAELGIGSVDITRLDEHGAAVDWETEYVSVNAPTDPIIVSKGADAAVIKEQLPTSLTITKADSSTVTSDVYWDFNSINLDVEGDYYLIGYLKETNGIRAAVPIYVGAFDREITTQYNFDESTQLDDFTSWFMPTTANDNEPAILTEGTDNDHWYINNGKLTYKPTDLNVTRDELAAGVTMENGHTYTHDAEWSGYAGNFGVAVLSTRTFENFILEVDFARNYNWNLVGFGAQDPTDAMSVFASQHKGGYSFHIESNGTSGNARLWGYDPDKAESDYIKTVAMGYNAGALATHHYKIIVSDGTAYLYVDDDTTPFVIDLPKTYKGGYIYLGLNSNGAAFDNLRITDLDAKNINITQVLTPELTDVVIDRKAGDALSVTGGTLLTADENGYEYELPYEMVSDTYRSHKEGAHTFTADITPLHGMTLSSSVKYEMTVTNRINGDYDTEKSLKYYFDHPNDFLDFYSHYSQENYKGLEGYYSGYDAELVPVDASQRWTVKGGKATNNYSANPGGYAGKGKAIGLSTLVLKDLNLMNFRLEMDYTQGTNFWYSYMLAGVQDPTKMFGSVNFTEGAGTYLDHKYSNTVYDSSLGGGVWLHLEQEGYFNMQGALDGVTSYRFTEDMSSTFISTYDKKVSHHMTIEVVDGFMTMWVDNSDRYYAGFLDEALGGFVGFAAQGNGATFDNFQITALDLEGKEIPIADAEQGMAPEPIPDTYQGWQPTREEWYFKFGKEYDHG